MSDSPGAPSLLDHLTSLRPVEVWVLLQMAGMLAVLAVLKRTASMPRIIRTFDAEPSYDPPIALDRLVQLASGLVRRLIGQRYCMQRSILLFHFMRKWRYPVRIHFGVAKQSGDLHGHAWLDLGGTPFAEQTDPRATFRVIYSFPPTS